jgi:hypothetical protein
VIKIDLLDLVDTIHDGMLDPGLTVRFANRFFGDTVPVNPENPSRDKAGLE